MIFKYSLQTFLSKIIFMLVGFVSSIIVVKIIGPSGKGFLSLFYALFGICTSVFILSIGNGIIYYINKKIDTKHIILNSIFFGFCVFAITLLFSIFTKNFISDYLNDYSKLLLITIIFFFGLTIFDRIFDALLIGLKRSKQYNLLQILRQILFFSLLYFTYLKYDIDDPKLIILISLFAVFIKIIFTIFYFRIDNLFKNSKISYFYLDKIVKYSLKAHIGVVVQKLNSKFDVIIVGLILPLDQLGYYSIALLFSEFIWIIPDSVGTFLFPILSEGNNKKLKALTTSKINRIVMPLIILGTIFILFFSNFLIPYFYGTEFINSLLPLLILSFGSVFFATSKILTKYFSGIGQPIINSNGALYAFIINSILTYFLTIEFGLVGAAISSSFAYFLMMLYYLKLFFKMNPDLKFSNVFIFSKSDFENLNLF